MAPLPRPPTEDPAPRPDHEVTQALGSSSPARAGKRSEVRVDFGRGPGARRWHSGTPRPRARGTGAAPRARCPRGGEAGRAGGAAGAYVGNNADTPGQRGSEWTPGPQRADVADGVHVARKRSWPSAPSRRRGSAAEQRTDVVHLQAALAGQSIDGSTSPGSTTRPPPARRALDEAVEPQLTFEPRRLRGGACRSGSSASGGPTARAPCGRRRCCAACCAAAPRWPSRAGVRRRTTRRCGRGWRTVGATRSRLGGARASRSTTIARRSARSRRPGAAARAHEGHHVARPRYVTSAASWPAPPPRRRRRHAIRRESVAAALIPAAGRPGATCGRCSGNQRACS